MFASLAKFSKDNLLINFKDKVFISDILGSSVLF